MTIWEAYCDLKLRNTFKHEYLAAQGMTPTKAQDAMTKFKVYIDRFNGIPDIVQLRQIETVDEMIKNLDYIFNFKWQNNIKDNYRNMPALFKQYGWFLQAENARRTEKIFDKEDEYPNLSTLESPILLPCWDEPYVDNKGKLTILANPVVVSNLRKNAKEMPLDENGRLLMVKQYYGLLFPNMTDPDWQRLITALFVNDSKKDLNRTGSKKSKLRLIIGEVVDQVMQPSVALSVVCNYIGNEKVAKLHLETNKLPLLTKIVAPGKEKFYFQTDDGWYINAMGDSKDKVKVIRMLATMFHLDVKTEIVL